MHNALQLTEPVSTEVAQMWNRPFKVAWADFPGPLGAKIEDPAVLSIAERWQRPAARGAMWPTSASQRTVSCMDSARDRPPIPSSSTVAE